MQKHVGARSLRASQPQLDHHCTMWGGHQTQLSLSRLAYMPSNNDTTLLYITRGVLGYTFVFDIWNENMQKLKLKIDKIDKIFKESPDLMSQLTVQLEVQKYPLISCAGELRKKTDKKFTRNVKLESKQHLCHVQMQKASPSIAFTTNDY